MALIATTVEGWLWCEALRRLEAPGPSGRIRGLLSLSRSFNVPFKPFPVWPRDFSCSHDRLRKMEIEKAQDYGKGANSDSAEW